jgi:hypothetical protein
MRQSEIMISLDRSLEVSRLSAGRTATIDNGHKKVYPFYRPHQGAQTSEMTEMSAPDTDTASRRPT